MARRGAAPGTCTTTASTLSPVPTLKGGPDPATALQAPRLAGPGFQPGSDKAWHGFASAFSLGPTTPVPGSDERLKAERHAEVVENQIGRRTDRRHGECAVAIGLNARVREVGRAAVVLIPRTEIERDPSPAAHEHLDAATRFP